MASRKGAEFSDEPTFLIFGLGNPGEEYASTRHNFGFFVADRLAREERLSFARGPGPCRSALIAFDGQRGILAKPTTYMNRSGEAAKALRAATPRLPLDRWLVVADDLDLPLGRLRVRAGGGPGGHNGLRSLIDALGTNEFARLRLGIGRPPGSDPEDVVDWVLEPFTSEEAPLVPEVVTHAVEAVRTFVAHGTEVAMNRTNAISLAPPPPPEGGRS